MTLPLDTCGTNATAEHRMAYATGCTSYPASRAAAPSGIHAARRLGLR